MSSSSSGEVSDSSQYTPKEIWVDHDMKRCTKNHPEARHATYNEEYDMYVIDH